MRRVVSYGGPEGVPASQRLKHKLSLTPGLHLLSCNSVVDEGFLAPFEKASDGRVIHRTSSATRNFYATASALKKFGKLEHLATGKDPFVPGKNTIFDEPVQSDIFSDGVDFSLSDRDHAQNLSGKFSCEAHVDDGETERLVTVPEVAFVCPINSTRGTNLEADADKASALGSLRNTAVPVSFDGGDRSHGGAGLLASVSNTPSMRDALAQSSTAGNDVEQDTGLVPSVSQDASWRDIIARRCTIASGMENCINAQRQAEVLGSRETTDALELPDAKERQLGEVETSVIFCDPQGQHMETKPLVVTLPEADGPSSTSLSCPRQDVRTIEAKTSEVDTVCSDKPWLLEHSAFVRETAALKIQSCCRKWLQMRRFRHVRRKVVLLQSLVRSSQESKLYQRLLKAAIVVQRNWRAVQRVRLVKHLTKAQASREQHRINNATVVLQKYWRGTRSRHVVKLLKMEQTMKDLQRRNNAATVFQKHWRGIQSRRLVRHRKNEEASREQQRLDNAAVLMQKYWRGAQSRRILKRLKMEQAVRDQQRVNNAATVLQKLWRAVQSRQLVKQHRIDSATVVLQKYWRGSRSRHVVKLLKMEQTMKHLQRRDNAATVFQKHWRAIQGRRLVRHLKNEEASREQQRLDNAAVLMQKYWRGAQSRRVLKFLRMEQAVRDQLRVNNAATVLQKLWRAVQSRQLVKQHRIDNATVVLQKYWRGTRSRHVVKLLKMEQAMKDLQKRNNAATVFQKHWRGIQSKRLVRHLKNEEASREQQRLDNAAILMQRYWRGAQSRRVLKCFQMEQAVRDQQRVNNAATALQKFWRAVQSRQLVKQHRIDNATVVMQKYWRGTRSRHVVKLLKMEQAMKDLQKRNNAATVFQKHWRAIQGRRLVRHLKNEEASREQQRLDNAAILMQRYWRGAQSRRVLKCFQMEQAVRDQQRVDNAATVLQKFWRAVQSRQLVKRLRNEEASREKCRIDHAAILLQKYWRGAQSSRHILKYLKMAKAERDLQRRSSAATVLEKYWRAVQSRRLLKDLKMERAVRAQQRNELAAVVVQKHWRALQSKRLVKNLKMGYDAKAQKVNAAIVLQKHWRGLYSRRLAKHMKREKAMLQQTVGAAVVVQKHWRALRSRLLVMRQSIEHAVREQQRADHAAIVVQKVWRGLRTRILVKDLKLKRAVREQQKLNDAAVVLQKRWRARQTNCLKVDQVLKEQERANNAATVLQKHWQAIRCRRLTKHLKMEQAVREQERVHHATLVLQRFWRACRTRQAVNLLNIQQAAMDQEKITQGVIMLQTHWRDHQSRLMVNHWKMEREGREQAVICIQAYARGNASRAKLKTWSGAASAIQKVWKQRQSRLASAVRIQRAFRAYADKKRKIHAAVVLQAHVRGFVVRRFLAQVPKLDNTSLRQDHSNEMFVGGVHANANPESLLVSAVNLHARDLIAFSSKGDCAVESDPTAFCSQDVIPAQSASLLYSSLDSVGRLGCGQASSAQQAGPSPNDSDDGDSYVTPVGDLHLQKNGGQEDWNHVAVDDLEECLDTCLSVLRPLPATLSTSDVVPELDVPEVAARMHTTGLSIYSKPVECSDLVGKASAPPAMPENEHIVAVSNASETSLFSKVTLPVHDDSQSDQILPGGNLVDSSCPTQEVDTLKKESPLQGKSHQRQSLKRNEQRLQQFAQVFLLQRHIALQQQRAQAAPPFPPRMLSGSGFPSQIAAREIENVDFNFIGETGQVPEQSIHTSATVTAVRPDEHSLICEIGNADEQPTLDEQPVGSQNCSVFTKQVVDRPGPDVVLDMVLLLRRMEEEHGNSEVEGGRTLLFHSGCGDIEEGIPLLDRNVSFIGSQNSLANFANAVTMRRISIPDVNAVLLVLIAMVVYTRTICRGVVFGTRRTHRRI